MIKVFDARFVTSATAPQGYPPGGVPEFAFVGRSNVGKSSMINALVGRRNLVRVSNTPGRTRLLNFFEATVDLHGVRQSVRLCDLPGYGFAKAPKGEKRQWREMISGYLKKRQELDAVVAIVDAVVGPTPDDQQMLAFLSENVRRILAVATKMDKLSKSQRKPRVAQLAGALGLDLARVVPFSATEPFGIDEVWESLLATRRDDSR